MNLNSKIELEFIKDLTWPEVFEVWRQNEENRKNWKQHYAERGFGSCAWLWPWPTSEESK